MKNKAFTIMEMAIVLVIVGLLVGGIMGGRELIKSNKVSTIVAEISAFSEAKTNFMEKYKFRPGDVPSAYLSNNFSGNASSDCTLTTLGDGLWDDVKEVNLAWLQLSYADMIKQKLDFNPCTVANPTVPDNRPASAADARIGYTFENIVIINIDPSNLSTGKRAFQHLIQVGNISTVSTAAFEVAIHRLVDAKIDQPDTPASGIYVANETCIDKNSGAIYQKDTTDLTCAGYLNELRDLDGSKF